MQYKIEISEDQKEDIVILAKEHFPVIDKIEEILKYKKSELFGYSDGEIIKIANSIFEGNGVQNHGSNSETVITERGGAITNAKNISDSIENVIFRNNASRVFGGAIYNTNSINNINNAAVTAFTPFAKFITCSITLLLDSIFFI